MRLLEKDIHDKQDTLISIRRQLEDVKKLNLELHNKLQVTWNFTWSLNSHYFCNLYNTNRLNTEYLYYFILYCWCFMGMAKVTDTLKKLLRCVTLRYVTLRRAKGLAKCAPCYEVSLYRCSSPYISLLVWQRLWFFIRKTSLRRGLLNPGSIT